MNNINPNELYHHGVLGMKWGKRKAQPATSLVQKKQNSHLNEAKTALKKAKKANNAAYRNATKLSNAYSKTRSASANAKWIRASNTMDKALDRYKQEKAKAKDIKKQYQKEYLSGKSAFARAMSKLTGSHKTYADMMFNLNDKRPNED